MWINYKNNTENFSETLFYILLIAGILLNATGLFSEIIEPDSMLYAGMSKRMIINSDWINLYGNGQDWLDKPHFPFWIAAISFKLLGITAFAYKLPAFIFWLIGLRYVYLLAKNLYNVHTANIATIVYIIALHGVIANFDVRAEPYLTTLTIGTIYHLYKQEKKTCFKHIFLAALFAGCAVMTKGIFILITIAGGAVVYWILSKQWKQFLQYKWWLTFALTFVFILPELYCLYVQFDMHPEKIVFGRTNVSGLRFFFWDSQFGRFFNTGPIKGSGDPLFFVHTLLWAFLPWSILLYSAVIKRIISIIKNTKTFQPGAQWILWGGALITFLIFSLSRFQLPHYIIIIFPQLSIIVAVYLIEAAKKINTLRNIQIIQSVLVVIAIVLTVTLAMICKFSLPYICIALILITGIAAFILFKGVSLSTIMIRTVLFAMIIHLFLNLYFYPNLLQYQSGMSAAKELNKQQYEAEIAVYKTDRSIYSLEFYYKGKVTRVNDAGTLQTRLSQKPLMIYTTAPEMDSLKIRGYTVTQEQSYDYFHITMLKLPFLKASTRASAVTNMRMGMVKYGL